MADRLPNPTELWQATLQWHPDADEYQAFQALYQAVLESNQQVNLTRITSPDDFWEKHLWDSLQGIAPWLTSGAPLLMEAPNHASRVIDIGTGGGFPGLPVALVKPHWQITLLDSTRKKIAVIEAIGQALGLNNIRLLAERAEQVAHQPIHRELFDLALVRAVGSTNTCAEYALPMLQVGGRAVLYRGQWTDSEQAELTAVLPRLGGKLLDVRQVSTPMSHGVRHYVDILKTNRTPDKYPRSVGVPAKTPLQGH